MAAVVGMVEGIKATLLTLGPSVSVILIVLGAITYGLSYLLPASSRGKWQSAAAGMVIGGAIVAAITGAAQIIASWSANVLT